METCHSLDMPRTPNPNLHILVQRFQVRPDPEVKPLTYVFYITQFTSDASFWHTHSFFILIVDVTKKHSNASSSSSTLQTKFGDSSLLLGEGRGLPSSHTSTPIFGEKCIVLSFQHRRECTGQWRSHCSERRIAIQKKRFRYIVKVMRTFLGKW